MTAPALPPESPALWRGVILVATLGMGWVFCFLALFALCLKIIAPRAGGGPGGGE